MGILRYFGRYKNKKASLIINIVLKLCISISVLALVFIVGYIFIQGVPHISLKLIFGEYSADNPSMSYAIVTTVILIALSLIISVPIGVSSAIYLTEYAKRGSRLVKIIRLATETLSGIPSVIYGLFGALFFGTALKFGYSILTGVFTLSIMILPTIIRATEESIKAVPDSYREGSFGLGAGKLRTILCIIVPSASRGIFSSIVLSVGRIVGETAALLFTLGTVAKMPTSLLDSSRSLAINMYISTRDGGLEGRNVAFATGVVLIIIVFTVNIISAYLSKKTRGKSNEN